jgi:hypothetical protein
MPFHPFTYFNTCVPEIKTQNGSEQDIGQILGGGAEGGVGEGSTYMLLDSVRFVCTAM